MTLINTTAMAMTRSRCRNPPSVYAVATPSSHNIIKTTKMNQSISILLITVCSLHPVETLLTGYIYGMRRNALAGNAILHNSGHAKHSVSLRAIKKPMC